MWSLIPLRGVAHHDSTTHMKAGIPSRFDLADLAMVLCDQCIEGDIVCYTRL